MTLHQNLYLQDILSEPESLRTALDRYAAQTLTDAAARLKRGEFSNVVLTGMGASYCAAYPTWLRLTALPIPVSWVETSELLHYAPGLVNARTLLVVISQSGRSAEILSLISGEEAVHPALLVGVTNDLESPLAQQAQVVLPIHAGPERTVSTRTYLNSLATLLLAAGQLLESPLEPARAALRAAADSGEAFLSHWEEQVSLFRHVLGLPQRMIIAGRGSSLAAVMNGSLILKEAAKVTYEGMSAPYFRHGPLELADENLTLWMFAGAAKTRGLNRDLAVEAQGWGAQVLWVDSQPDLELQTLLVPTVDDFARPLVEILPLQLYSLAAAELNGMEAGTFRRIGKVTDRQ